METKCGFGGHLDEDDEVDYGEGRNLPSHGSVQRPISAVLYLAAVMDIKKLAPYSWIRVQDYEKCFPACAKTTKDLAVPLRVRRYVHLSAHSFMRLTMLVYILG